MADRKKPRARAPSKSPPPVLPPIRTTSNQSEVITTTSSETSQPKLATSAGFYVTDTLDGSHLSITEESLEGSVSTAEDLRHLSDIFSASFRGARNRNLFAQRIFSIMGLQMSFSFFLCFFILWEKPVKAAFDDKYTPLSITFGLFICAIIMSKLYCSRWMRGFPNNIIVLILITISATIVWATLAIRYNFLTIIFLMSGSLMATFFISSALVLQKRVTDRSMLIILTATSIIVTVLTTVCITLLCTRSCEWLFSGISAVLTVVEVIFVLVLLRNMVLDQELSLKDSVFGAITLYMSITTVYAFRMLYVCITRKPVNYMYDEEVVHPREETSAR